MGAVLRNPSCISVVYKLTMPKFDITAVINGHGEGLLAHASLNSLSRSADVAAAAGLRVEMLAVLDKPNALTLQIFEEYASRREDLRIVRVEHGDLGYARNSAADEANGKWIGFLDADDIWCTDWLVAAHKAAEADPRNVAWHPEVNVCFGATPNIFLHVDMEDPSFHVAQLAFTNAWTSLVFTSRDFLRSVPYTGTDFKNHIGYEDWGWNISVVNSGGLHKIVPNTSHAIRTRHTSLVKQTTAAGCIPRPSDLFRNAIRNRAGKEDDRLLLEQAD